MENKVRVPLLIGAVVVALLLGMLLAGTGLIDRIIGGPDPKAIATSSLESMRAQNRLVPFVARYVSVVSARQSRFGFAAERTLVLPGTVRYELDLSKLNQKDVQWDGASNTLSLRLPPIEIAGPDVDLTNIREFGSAGVLGAVTDARVQLDRANRAAAVADLRKQAQGDVPMRLAREAARDAVERSFAMPLTAAGFENVKVVARFPEEGADDPSFITRSNTYDQAVEEARKQREGQR